MSHEFAESDEFRLHVRNLLYEYSITHYTTNYVAFTEDLVSEFLEDLRPISLTDRYSFTLAPDPFDTFSRLHLLSSIPAYDETPQTTNDALLYLKKVMGSFLGVPKTDKIVHEDTYGPSPPQEPFFPALTRVARQSTPKLGDKNKRNIPENFEKLLTSQNISSIPVEPVPDQVLVPEEILQLKHQIKPEELTAVKSLLQGTADMMRTHQSYKNKYLDPVFLREVPFSEPRWPEEPFMPIFPKARLPRSGMSSNTGYLNGLESLSDIPSFVIKKVEADDPEENMSMQNLIVVDGWQTIQSSPPSTPPSKLSDDEDELDQLFLGSSPNTEPSIIEELMEAKMEPVLMPRSRQIGGTSGITPHILAGKSLASFLQPLLVPGKTPSEPKTNEAPNKHLSMSPTSLSLIGQPPSELERDIVQKPSWQDEIPGEGDLDNDLKNLYSGHGMENIIMNETIDNQIHMMIEVPDLPEPNVHLPDEMHIPKAFQDFVILPGTDQKGRKNTDAIRPSHPPQRFLKKAKGRQSLGLALSWIPFTTDKRLPSVLELIGVQELFDDKQPVNENLDLVKVEALLQSLNMDDEDTELRYSWSEELRNYRRPDFADDFKILQNREERWRLAKLEGRLEDGTEMDLDETEHQSTRQGDICDYDSDERLEDERSAKRSRLDNHVCQTLGKDVPIERLQSGTSSLPEGYVNNNVDVHQVDMDALPVEDFYDPAAGSPIFLASDDKENWPPITSSLSTFLMDDDCSEYHTPDDDRQRMTLSGCDDSGAFAMEGEGSFRLLSFETGQPTFDRISNGDYMDHDQRQEEFLPMQHSMDFARNSLGVAACPQSNVDQHTAFALSIEPDIASHSLGILGFAQLRAKKVTVTKPTAVSDPSPVPDMSIPDEPQTVPQEILDQNTICLPNIIGCASSVHRYLASIDFIQKHALVRALQSEECAVELAERQSLSGVDLILDPSCAIIFLSLFTLSARCEAYVENLCQQSWKFSRLLIIFEAYPEHRSKRSTRKQGHDSSATGSELCAYTPPIIKAIKKFRRDVDIADACGTKCPDTKVEYAFADTVNQAALLTRFYGDQVEGQDETQGAIWGEREWLAADFVEDDEARLAAINGLNHFSSSIILCQLTLQEFVDMSAQERLDGFAPYVGVEAMMICNTDLDARFQALSAYSTTTDSEPDDVPY